MKIKYKRIKKLTHAAKSILYREYKFLDDTRYFQISKIYENCERKTTKTKKKNVEEIKSV